MDSNDITVEQSLDEMLNSLNSINDSFINDYFENTNTDVEESNELEKEQLFEENNTIEDRLEKKEEQTVSLEDELLFSEKRERIFDINREIPKVEPKIDDILDLVENSVNGEEFFDRIEDEFIDK